MVIWKNVGHLANFKYNELHWYDHIAPILQDLHWLWSPDGIDFKLAVLIYRCLHGLTSQHLSHHIQRVTDSNHRHLQSLPSSQLVIPHTHLATISDHTFPVADSCLCNSVTMTLSHHYWSSRDRGRLWWISLPSPAPPGESSTHPSRKPAKPPVINLSAYWPLAPASRQQLAMLTTKFTPMTSPLHLPTFGNV